MLSQCPFPGEPKIFYHFKRCLVICSYECLYPVQPHLLKSMFYDSRSSFSHISLPLIVFTGNSIAQFRSFMWRIPYTKAAFTNDLTAVFFFQEKILKRCVVSGEPFPEFLFFHLELFI